MLLLSFVFCYLIHDLIVFFYCKDPAVGSSFYLKLLQTVLQYFFIKRISKIFKSCTEYLLSVFLENNLPVQKSTEDLLLRFLRIKLRHIKAVYGDPPAQSTVIRDLYVHKQTCAEKHHSRNAYS